MKKVYIIILTFLCSFAQYNSSKGQIVFNWSQQNSGTTNLLYTCKAVSEMVCWAAGSNGTVRRTTDGGTNWINANPNPGVLTGTIRNMEAIDGNTAWVTTETSTSTKIYRTSNGGNNWVSVYSNTTGLIKGIRMYDTMNGIAIGSPISGFWNVLLTTDGGNSWNSAPNPPAADFIHQAVHNSFQVDGPSNIYWGTSLTSIFMSTNGGSNYTENSTPGAGIYIFALRISPNGTGLAAGTSMSRSTNGGVTFQSHSVPGAGNINGIESSDNYWWYIRGTKVYHSTDNGVSWTEQYTSPQTMNHLDFPGNISGNPTGWAVGIGGHIHKMTGTLTGLTAINSSLPNEFNLGQNYPNPFNPTTNINFKIKNSNFVSLRVYDVSGKEVAILINEVLRSGEYVYTFSGEKLPSGVYFYRLESDEFTAVRKMIMVK